MPGWNAAGSTTASGRRQRGLLESENRVNLVEGPAGAGKSSMLGTFDEGMRRAGQSVTYLATTAKAAEVLEKDGFDAHTVARFLVDEKMQVAARGGRVVIDETSMLGHKDAVRLFKLAEKLDLKPVFLGDPMQHGSVPRGSFLHVLKEYGHIRPFKLTRIMRQETPEYRAAAELLSEGRTLEGFDALDGLGWVRELGDDAERVRQVAAEYLRSHGKTANPSWSSRRRMREAAAKSREAIRSKLRQVGKLGTEEHAFTRLVAVDSHGSGAGAGDDLPARRRAPVPPECQGLHQGRPAHRRAIRRRCRSIMPASFRSTGPRPSAWPRATRSASPARSRRSTASIR